MAVGDRDQDDLERLLAEVRRTIRENDQFIRNLKDEAVDSGEPDDADDPVEFPTGADDEEYEEL